MQRAKNGYSWSTRCLKNKISAQKIGKKKLPRKSPMARESIGGWIDNKWQEKKWRYSYRGRVCKWPSTYLMRKMFFPVQVTKNIFLNSYSFLWLGKHFLISIQEIQNLFFQKILFTWQMSPNKIIFYLLGISVHECKNEYRTL